MQSTNIENKRISEFADAKVELKNNRWAAHQVDISSLQADLETWAKEHSVAQIEGEVEEHNISLRYDHGKLALLVFGQDFSTEPPGLEIQRMVVCDRKQRCGLMTLLQQHLISWYNPETVKYTGVDADGDGRKFIRAIASQGMLESIEMQKTGPSYEVVGNVTNFTRGTA